LIAHSVSNRRSAASAQTREQILEAAFRTLSGKGYESTTVKDIAEEAGVAQGLVHYHFRSKQGLVLAVLARCCAEMQLPDQDDAIGTALEAFEHFKAMLRSGRDVNRLYIQLIGVGLHDGEVGAGVLDDVRQNRGKVEAIARGVLAERSLSPQLAPALAGAVWGGTLGIMVQALVDPDFNADAAVDALAAMAVALATHPEHLARLGQDQP
jgi:AcrR family transcriptional regulator